ncbi:MAG: ribonuclease H family protein [Tissierellia bacterium]|nr:ribonuclease H family protein [Tissierellia bacterium]
MKKNFYAVKVGRNPGVYKTWDECNIQVKGFKGAVYKKFPTEEEALKFISESEEKCDELKDDEIIAYVDGSYNITTYRFGYGIVLIDGEKEEYMKDSFFHEELKNQRNVAGEVYGSVFAIKEALRRNKKKIYLYFDYMGIREWALGNWKTNIELTQKYKSFYDEIKDKIDVVFVKVKAHSNDKYNDMADNLAKEAVGIK